MKYLKVMAIIFLVLVCGALYTISFTSVPLRIITSMLNKMEAVSIEGAEGSIAKGFKVKTVNIGPSDNGELFLIKNLETEYKLPSSKDGRPVLHIKNIGIDKFVIISSKVKKAEKTTHKDEKDEADAQSHFGNSSQSTESAGGDILIDLIQIKNVLLKSIESDEGFLMKNFMIKKMFITRNLFEFEKLDIKSNYLDLNGSATIVNDASSKIKLDGVLKTKLIDKLKKDLDFKIIASLKDKKMNFNATASNNGLNFLINNKNRGSLSFNDFDFQESFKSEWPLTYMNGQFVIPFGNNPSTKIEPVDNVTFKINGILYEMVNETFKIAHGKDKPLQVSFDGQSGSERIKFAYTKISDEESNVTVTEY